MRSRSAPASMRPAPYARPARSAAGAAARAASSAIAILGRLRRSRWFGRDRSGYPQARRWAMLSAPTREPARDLCAPRAHPQEQTRHPVLFVVRTGAFGADHLPARLAGAVDLVAPSAAGVRRARLSRDR